MIESEKNLRKVSGLNTSEEHIKKVLTNKENAKTVEEYGFFLDKGEIKNIEKIGSR